MQAQCVALGRVLIEHPTVQELFKDVIEQFAYGQLTADEAGQEIVDGLTRALRRL